jgi:hypothetical protein
MARPDLERAIELILNGRPAMRDARLVTPSLEGLVQYLDAVGQREVWDLVTRTYTRVAGQVSHLRFVVGRHDVPVGREPLDGLPVGSLAVEATDGRTYPVVEWNRFVAQEQV